MRRNSLVRFFTYKIALWVLLLLAILIVGVFSFAYNKGLSETKSQLTTTINNVEKVNEHVFLNAGITLVNTVEKENETLKRFNISIPFSEKKAIIIQNYIAKFGIKDPVKISETGEKTYQVRVPKFQVIGVEQDPVKPYQLYHTSEGLLSFGTEDIDTGEEVAKNLANEKQIEHLNKNINLIKESCEEYYTSLFQAIDPEIQLTFFYSE